MAMDPQNTERLTLAPGTPDAEPIAPRRIVVLISGNGSNLQALIEAQAHDRLDGEVVAVISNEPGAYGLKRARAAGVDAVALPHREYDNREAFDRALIKVIDRHEPDLIVLAGFMRLLTPAFVQHFLGRMLNIHPSLLPAYQGLNTHRRVIEDGVADHGCSVHFVTEELDGGPVVIQAALDVTLDDTEERLKERIQAREHLILPIAVNWYLQGRLSFVGDAATLDGTRLPAQGLRLSHEDAAEELDEDIDPDVNQDIN